MVYPNHACNLSWMLDPPLKNSRAEALAVVMAIVNLIKDKQFKIRVKTDSQRITDLYNEKRLTLNDANIIKYQNYDI